MNTAVVGSRKAKSLLPLILGALGSGIDIGKLLPKFEDNKVKIIGQADIEKLQKAEEKRKMRAKKRGIRA